MSAIKSSGMLYLPLYQNEGLGSRGNFEKPRHWKVNASLTYIYQNLLILDNLVWLISPGENKTKKNVVGMHIYIQAKARLPGLLMVSNSNCYSPKIIWGLREDLPDSAGLVTVKRKGTVISYFLLL